MDITAVFQNFKNEWLGKRIADPTLGQLGSNSLPASQWYQCVSMVKQYLRENFGLQPGFWGDAIDYWTHTNPAILAKFDKISAPSSVQVGDIPVFSSNHMGIATGNVSGANFEMLEQNGQTGSGTGIGGDAIRTRYIPLSRLQATGVLRPKGAVLAAAPAPAPAPPVHEQARVGQTLVLPSSVSSWRIYKVGGPWTSVNPDASIALLNPAEYGGLEYQIQGNPAANIYVITTQMFGQVAIYAGPDTPASFKDNAPTPPPAPPTPVPAPAPSNIVYSKLDAPLNLVVNKNPTNKWNLGFADDKHATSVALLAQGSPFTAVGKAQRTDGDKPAYFMSAEDFGSADTSGVPTNNVGVNTVDLSPAPTVEGAETTAPAEESVEEKVDVKVLPPQFMQSYNSFLSPVDYLALRSVVVHDIAGQAPDVQLVKGQLVEVGGTFEKDGQKYYRTRLSIANGSWYGIPVESLIRKGDISDAELDKLLRNAEKFKTAVGKYTSRQKAIIKVATIEGFFARLLHLNKK